MVEGDTGNEWYREKGEQRRKPFSFLTEICYYREEKTRILTACR